MNKRVRASALLWSCVLVVVLPLMLVLLSGCAGAPVQAPRSDLFGELRKPDVRMPAPVALPERPRAVAVQVQGAPMMAFDARGAQQLLARDEVAEANTDLARACQIGFDEMSGAYSVLLDQAQAHERMFNTVGQRWAESETALQRQGTAHQVENTLNRVLLFLALGLAL